MVNERWKNLDKVDISEEEQASRVQPDELDLADPLTAASAFLEGLGDLQQYRAALPYLIHPAMAGSWGDFSDAASRLASIENWAMGNQPNRALGRPDVAYVTVLRGVDQPFRSNDLQPVMAAAVLTLIWSDAQGMWLVVSFGQYTRPDEIPAL